MSVESLPKYMFLHEDSEQMKDKRIQTATFYEDVEGRVEKRYKKRVNNTFPLKKPTHSDGIFNLEYSNKYGLMLMATDNEVLIVKNDQLENHLLSGKQEVADLPKISFSGSIFLSPNQELLAICTDSLVQIVNMATLPTINKVPAANPHNSHRVLWVDDRHLLFWNFLDKAYLMKVQNGAVSQIEGVSECTGASIVGNSLLIMEKLNVSVFKLGETKAVAKIDLSYDDHESFLYDYSFIVEIFRVNVHGSTTNLYSRLKVPLNEEDILGLVMVYYDDEDQEPNQRYITYFKGNLLSGEINIRGNEMFFSSKEDKAIYYDNEEKIPFSVKVIYSGYSITVMIERSEVIYIIDPFQSFEKINIYETSGKTELKDPEGNFFRGMGIIRHLFSFEKQIPEDANTPLLDRIVKDFHAEFMTLYFASQETNLNIPFPPSIIAVTSDKIYRRYAVSSLEGIDKDKDEDIIAEMEKIKRSPHLVEITSKINSQGQGASSLVSLALEQGALATQGEKKQVSGDKKEEKKPTSLFGSAPSLFSSTAGPNTPLNNANPFAKNIPSSKPTLFGQGSAAENVTSMFPKPSIPKDKQQSQPKAQTSSLFAKSIFGMPKETDNTSSLFAQPDKRATGQPSKGPSIFGNLQPKTTPEPFVASSEAKPSFFSTSQAQNSLSKEDDKQKGQTKQMPKDTIKEIQHTVKEGDKPKASEQKKADKAFGDLFKKSGDQPSIFGQLQPKQSKPFAFKIEPKAEPTPEGGSSEVKVVSPPAVPQLPALQQPQQVSPKIKEVKLSNQQTAIIQNALKERLRHINKEQVSLEEIQQYESNHFQKFIKKSQYLKKKLRDFKGNSEDYQDKLTLYKVQDFCDKILKDLENPQNLMLGAPLRSLLIKAEVARQAYQRYEWMFDSTLKKKLTKKEVQEALNKFQEEINTALFFINAINPHKNSRSVSAISQERKDMISKRQLDNVQDMFNSKIIELRTEAQDLSGLLDEVERKNSNRSQRVNASQISSQSQKGKYDFSSFVLQDQIEQKHERLLRKTRQPVRYSRTSDQLIVIKMVEIDPKPKFVLPPFEVIPTQANPIARTGKIPTTASFSQVNQARGVSAQPKPKEKVAIPMVNTKLPKLEEKEAISEAFQKSDAEQEITIPIIAMRQISRIQPQEPKKNVVQTGNSIFGQNKMGPVANQNKQQQNTLTATKIQKPEQKTSKKEEKQGSKEETKVFPPATSKIEAKATGGFLASATSLFGNATNLPNSRDISQKNQEKLKEKPVEQQKLEVQKPNLSEAPKSKSLFGSGGSLFNFGSVPVKKEEVTPKVENAPEKKKEDISIPLDNLKVDQKKELEVPKTLGSNFTLGAVSQDKKDSGLFGTLQNSKPETGSTGLFMTSQKQGGLSGSLFAVVNPAEKTSGNSMSTTSQQGINTMFGLVKPSNSTQKRDDGNLLKKPEATVTASQSSIPTSSQIPVSNISKDSTQKATMASGPQNQEPKPADSNKPATSDSNKPTLIANDDKQKVQTIANQQKSTPPIGLFALSEKQPQEKINQKKQTNLFGGVLGVAPPTLPSHGAGTQPAFGAANKFMDNSQANQPQSTGFDPSAMSFGGGSAQRTFTSFGNQQGTGASQPIFQPTANTSGGSLFAAGSSSNQRAPGNQSLFANTQNNNFFGSSNPQQSSTPQNIPFGQSQNSMFGQGNAFGQNSTVEGGMFGQNSGTSPFGQGSSGGSSNFLLGMGQGSMPNPPPGMNPSLMAPRK